MPPRRSLVTLDDAYDEAVRLLARKARSAAEVSATLQERGATAEHAASVVARLKAHRHLDDAELAADQAYALLEGKGLAPEAVVEALVGRGLPASDVRAAIDEVREARTELELCRQVLARRLKGRSLSPSAAAREGRALSRLGWDEEVVARVLETALSEASLDAQET